MTFGLKTTDLRAKTQSLIIWKAYAYLY